MMAMRRQNRKTTETKVLPTSTDCGMSTVEGPPNVGTVVKWFGGLSRGGRKLAPYGGKRKKTQMR